MESRTWRILAFVGLTVVVLPQTSPGADLTAGDLLSRYARYLEGFETIQYHLREETTSKGGDYPDWTWTNSGAATFVKSGARWRFRLHAASNSAVETESEQTFDGKTSLTVTRVDRTTQELAHIDRATAEKLLESGMRGRVETMVVAEVDADQAEARDAYIKQNQSCNLYGYLPADGLTVLQILRETGARLKTRHETVDGRSCQVLEGKTSHGRVTLWLDPDASFAPVRLWVVKGEEDLMGKIAMKALKAPKSELGPYPKLPMRGMEIRIEYRIGHMAGRDVIVGYTRLGRYVYEGGADFTRRDEANLSDITFDPTPNMLEPSIPIPDETPVVIRNSIRMRAKWSGGKLILDYDKPTVAKLKGEWRSENSDSSSWGRPVAFGAASVLVCCIVFGARTYHRRKR